MRVLVNLISGQNAPVFFGYKLFSPDKVINVFSNESAKQKDWFKNVLKDVDSEDVRVNAYDFADCKFKYDEIIKNNIFNELILNFTNGTKIMSVAGFEAFRENNLLCIYIDSERMFVIKHRYGISEKMPFRIDLTLNEYFLLYGNKFEVSDSHISEKDVKTRHELSEYLAVNYRKISKPFIKLASMNKSGRERFLSSKDKITGEGVEIISAADSVIIKINKQGIKKREFEFKDKTPGTVDFLSGKWYESYIYNYFNRNNLFSDILSNINVKYQENIPDVKTKNEIDVAGIRNNVLYIFEVKTGFVNQDPLNKLRTLKDYIGGRYSVPVLISYFPQEKEVEERAAEYGINLVYNRNLNNLLTEIKQFKGNVRL